MADFGGGISGFFGYAIDVFEDLEAVGDEAVAESVGDPFAELRIGTGG